MRKIKLILMFCVLWSFSSAQNITTAEYFFDGNDLGFGNNTTLTVTQANENYNVSTSSLSNGFHDLYIRVFDQAANEGAGVWSHYDRTTFYISDFPTGQNVVAARYFIDELDPVILEVDPVNTNITESYSIQLDGLDEGFHSFYIQTQVEDGTWSLYDRQIFYVKDLSDLPSDIVAAEYWINGDPGIGDGEPIDISMSPLTIPIASDFPVGDHSFCIRVQNSNGDWSLYCCATFTVIDPTVGLEESLYNAVEVSPNPFADTITINTTRAMVFESVTVYDITGKQVYNVSDDLRRFDLSHLESGIYILKITTESEQATFKLVKQ